MIRKQSLTNGLGIGAVLLSVILVYACKERTDSMTASGNNSKASILLDSSVTRELFLQWRSPRLSNSNPERMNNPVWEWLVKSRISAFQANDHFKGPSAISAGPGWCFDRLGQSTNKLPDGRVVLIAGEHEDFYDPDFYIYNDVVILHPDGHIDIFGYPRDVFPPTDFHSATLSSNQIVVIGNLGYMDQRRPGEIQVKILNLEKASISSVETSGKSPGWLHRHQATLSEDGNSILIQKGQVDQGGDKSSFVENIDDWRLHLNDWRWERLTQRQWLRWEVRRKDRARNHLFDYQQAVWAKKFPEIEKANRNFRKQFNEPSLAKELGKNPDLDLFERLYKPPVLHEEMPEEENEYKVHRIRVNGVVIRYVEEFEVIQVTIEGKLPQKMSDAITQDLLHKLGVLENSPCELIRL